jgi:hypothetical protein
MREAQPATVRKALYESMGGHTCGFVIVIVGIPV